MKSNSNRDLNTVNMKNAQLELPQNENGRKIIVYKTKQ